MLFDNASAHGERVWARVSVAAKLRKRKLNQAVAKYQVSRRRLAAKSAAWRHQAKKASSAKA